MATFKPDRPEQVAEAVRWAASAEEALELVGAGTRRALGRPMQAAHTLDLSALSGIQVYEPEELVLTARAGTPLGEIAEALHASGQMLAFEPPDLGPLLGAPAWAATLGGTVGAGWSGPRRPKAGAVRDHVLGIEAVSGRGEPFKAGGRVVKNVTGYDLPKLACGAFGTLAALTAITVKVLPAPETARTLLVLGLDDRAGIAALVAALQGPAEVSAAAHLPDGIAAPGKPDGVSATALRLEGVAPSVAFRMERLRALAAPLGPLEELDRDGSVGFWRAVRDVHPFVAEPERIVWRLSVPPEEGPNVAARLAKAQPGARHYFDWGGGLVWLALPGEGGAQAAAVRKALGRTGGHATLVRAPAPVRAGTDVFQPQPPALTALTARVKEQFDPLHLLNPGRMYLGV
ncbi:MAG TPA: glycolate oxidase subunit GlcE [Azospirillaceae bacterium]|nr:glycolate oxidase subunit GlcE [Azospirillaceae bacterium]